MIALSIFFSDGHQDCACLEITNNEESLTTLIFATRGLNIGAHSINSIARRYGQSQIDVYKECTSTDVKAFMSSESFDRATELWWNQFELNYKRNLKSARENALLDHISCVPTPELMTTVEKASSDLADEVKGLIQRMLVEIKNMTARDLTVSWRTPLSHLASDSHQAYHLYWRILSKP